MVGIGMLVQENFRRLGLSGIVHRYHNFSVLGIVREGIQAVLVGHVDIGDPNAGGIVKAWKDFGFLNSKCSRDAGHYDSREGQWLQHDSQFHGEDEAERRNMRKSEVGGVQVDLIHWKWIYRMSCSIEDD